jgi:hypothetical protein
MIRHAGAVPQGSASLVLKALQLNTPTRDNEVIPLRAIGEQTPMLAFERV